MSFHKTKKFPFDYNCSLKYNPVMRDYTLNVAYQEVVVSSQFTNEIPADIGSSVEKLKKLAKSLFEQNKQSCI